MARLRGKQVAIKRLRALRPDIVAVAEATLRQEADKLADTMRQRVPVLTGALKASIRTEDVPGKKGNIRIIAGGVPETRKKVRKGVKNDDFLKAQRSGGNKGEFDYARAVEFGHTAQDGTHVQAQPFFYGSYRSKKRAIGRRMSTAIRKKIKAGLG